MPLLAEFTRVFTERWHQPGTGDLVEIDGRRRVCARGEICRS